MDDFTASEEHGHLAAIAILEERADVLEFGLVVMFVRLGTHLDFLDLHDSLTLFRVLLLFLLLVLELAVVHDAADRRRGVGRNLHQVTANFAGHGNGLIALQNTQLFPFRADDTHFPGVNQLITTNPVIRHTPARPQIRRSYSSSLLS